MENIKSAETNTRELIYETDFRNWLRERKGLPESTIGLLEQVETINEKKCKENLCATCIDINREGNELFSKSFKIEIGNSKFFLKVESGDVENEGASEEINDTILAKETLKSSNLIGVRVVKSLLGYSDKNGKSYYVAEWIDLPILDEILDTFDNKKKENILERLEGIRETLEGYREVSPSNMFYDEEKDEIVLFDLHL